MGSSSVLGSRSRSRFGQHCFPCLATAMVEWSEVEWRWSRSPLSQRPTNQRPTERCRFVPKCCWDAERRGFNECLCMLVGCSCYGEADVGNLANWQCFPDRKGTHQTETETKTRAGHGHGW